MHDAKDITTTWVSNLDLSNYSAVLLTEGAPCQPFSPLNAEAQGFADDQGRADLVHHFVAIRDALAAHCSRQGVDFQWFFEEVGTMTATNRAKISRLLSSAPVIIQSADFGWVHRCRAYWGAEAQLRELLNLQIQIPGIEMHDKGDLIPEAYVIRWVGAPIPAEWSPSQSASEWRFRERAGEHAPAVPGSSWRPRFKGGRFATFVQAWPGHPKDRGDANDDDAVLALEKDHGRYPLAHYRKTNLLFYKDSNRKRKKGRGYEYGFPLPADDREALSGWPVGHTACISQDESPSEADSVRCSAIGNGWHIPSVLITFVLLLVEHFPTRAKAAHAQPAFDDHSPAFNDTFNFDHRSTSLDFKTRLWMDAFDRLDEHVPPTLLDKA